MKTSANYERLSKELGLTGDIGVSIHGKSITPKNIPATTHNFNDLDMRSNVKVNTETKNKVDYRSIAKMLVYVSGVKYKPEEYLAKVEEYMAIITDMPIDQKNALKFAYIFSNRVNECDRLDFFQDMSITLLEKRINDEKLAYTIARCDWLDWYRKYKDNYDKSISLDAILDDPERYTSECHEIANSELFCNSLEYETTQNKKASELIKSIKSIPQGVRILEIGSKRLNGHALNNAERKALCLFLKRYPEYSLLR